MRSCRPSRAPGDPAYGEALGVVETRTVAAVIGVADAGIKAAEVKILQIRMADGLGGKGYVYCSPAKSTMWRPRSNAA